MKRVLITGVAGYVGLKLAERLLSEPGVRYLAGIDIREPATPPEGLDFIRADVRAPLDDIVRGRRIDTLVHAAFVLPPIHDVALMEDINVNGTAGVLEAAIRCGVRHFLYTSSATAYGFHPDNEFPLTEESPLRGNEDFTYCRTKRRIELMIRDRMEAAGGMTITVLRPCFVVGPGFSNPLAEYLGRKIVILPSRSRGLQFVHEDDLADIFMVMLRKGAGGVFNVGAEGEVSFREMVRILGGLFVPMPAGLLSFLNGIAWNLRLSFLSKFPSPALNMALHPWIVSSGKLVNATGFTYRYTSRQAFELYARSIKKKK